MLTALRSPPQQQLPAPLRARALPAWPVLALLWCFPVWWLGGLLAFIPMVLAAVMAALMLVRGRLSVVPGVLPYLAFVLWIIPCALMLDSNLRLVGYGLRFGQFAAAGVILLYVVNARERLTTSRLLTGLLVVWLTTVVGGYLGMLWPDVRLITPTGLLLPGALTSNEYVRDLVFPAFAEVQMPYGAEEPYARPSAPFTYANSWGSAMAVLTPIALAKASSVRSREVRILVIGALAAAIAPAIATSNRGLFLTLIASILYVAVRLALRGNGRALLAVLVGSLATGALLVSAGLLESFEERQEVSDTTSGRSQLYQETFERTLASPVLGYGAPRPSFTAEISVGTQGQLWALMFSYGFVGLALFLWFLWGATLRTWRAPGTTALWLHACLLSTSLMIFFYGLEAMTQVSVVIVAALLLRERCHPDSRLWVPAGRASGGSG